MSDDERVQKIMPVALGLVDAVRENDAVWIRHVCESIADGRIDWRALVVVLASMAGGR